MLTRSWAQEPDRRCARRFASSSRPVGVEGSPATGPDPVSPTTDGNRCQVIYYPFAMMGQLWCQV
ncbi:MAG: hypothetical protein ACKO3H_14460, partial [Verrucomicrobiota bacterium]